jgi:predicted MFS family arabinose efflux permease
MRKDIKRALVAVFVARTAANAGLRVVYPFLPAISRGLGISHGQLASVIALRNLGGFAAPAVARVSERHGRRSIMLLAIGAVAAGCLVTITGSFVLAAVGIVMVGFAKPAFDLPMQAWFGDRVPYRERGRVFGITELAWATSLIVAAPASGFLIAATDWRAPFVLVAVLAVIGSVAVARGVEPDRPHEHPDRKLRFDATLRKVIAVVVLFSMASEVPFILYGQWLEGNFGLSVAGIGTFTLAIAAAELTGEGLVVAVSDRIGLKRMWLGGLVISSLAYLSFGLVGSSLGLAVLVVVVWITSFEVTIVASIPFVSELSPARERVLSMVLVSVGAGRAAGALLAQPLFSAGGMTLGAAFSAACAISAALILLTIPDHPVSYEESG